MVIDVPPYFFICLSCKHEFVKKHKLVFFCPKCRSTQVVSNFKIVK
ncbi:hydrogenase maturation nickel metallochaperone HypA [Vibrio alginolyticus]|nr:hydrogenase maturation nickel metallochaperone HypA [Vibrio alginolyticus]